MGKYQRLSQHGVLAILFLLPAFCLAQVSRDWVKRYNGTGNLSPDRANGLVIDASSNVYVTGGSGGDYATIKYNDDGDRKWTKRYDGPGDGFDQASVIAVDASGNVYVTGLSQGDETGLDYATIKYDDDGSTKWVRRYNATDNFDGATALAVDAHGNVYVTGRSEGNGTGSDYATIKYNASGVQQWVARYNGPGNNFDAANAIAVDASGNVYVAGQSTGNGTGASDYATIKYNASGVEQWVARHDGPVHGRDVALALAVDASGNVYVTGGHAVFLDEEDGDRTDYATIKYNASGVEQWVATFGHSAFDFARSLAVDDKGSVYITGSGGTDADDADFITIKYNGTGVQQWAAIYNGPGDGTDDARDLAVDEDGNVFVTGQSASLPSDQNAAYATIKYTSGGVQQWVARYNGPGNLTDGASALAVDDEGRVFVTGSSFGSGTEFDYATIRYDDDDGDQDWVKRYTGTGDLAEDIAHDLALDSDGNVYVTGGATREGSGMDYTTVKYNDEGDKKWTKKYNGPGNGADIANAIAIDADDNVYVTGGSVGTGASFNNDYATVKYDKDGNTQWARRYNGPTSTFDEALAIAVDNEGNVYVTGVISTPGADYATIKYDRDGNTKWVKWYNGPGDGFDQATSIAVDHEGNVYVTGFSVGIGTGTDYATIKYDADGNELWVRRYNGPGNSADDAAAIAVDASGNVYVTGLSDGAGTSFDYATVKYDGSGNELWVARYNGPGNGIDAATALDVGAGDNVFVTGRSAGSGTSFDYATIKYNAAGAEQWVKRYNGPLNGADEARALALDASDNVYVTGSSEGDGTGADYATVKYDGSGTELWVQRYDAANGADAAASLAVDDESNVYVTGTSFSNTKGNDYATIKYEQEQTVTTSIDAANEGYPVSNDVPAQFKVSHYPNPVATTTRIHYELPVDGQVSIRVYDALGRTVALLENASRKAGYHHTDLDATGLQKGVYYYQITVSTEKKLWTQSRKMVVVR
jgi:uncharacterized delta-60 repeat protein